MTTMNADLSLQPRRPTAELLRLAAPIIAIMVSRMAMGFIDFVMVSWLGTEAQAAVSPASLLVFVIACLGMGVAQAVQTFVSQANGRGEPHECGAYAWQTLYIAAVLTVVTAPLAVTTALWYGWITRLAQHAPHVAAMEIAYIQICLWSVGPATVCAGLDGFFNGVQKPRVGLIAVLAAIGANVVGNYVLIFGKLGFPALGIAGAAIATVIAWCIRALILTIALCSRSFDRRFHTRRSVRLHLSKLRGILRIGAPTGLQWVIDLGAWVVFMAGILPMFGTVAMAASNVALQYMHLSFMPAVGVGVALCSQVGFWIGRGQPDEALLRTRVALRVTVGYMGAVGLLFLVTGYPLMALLSQDSQVISAGVFVLIWAAIFQVFDAMGITYINALRGAGDTRWPTIVVALCSWLVFVAGGYALARGLPSWGLSGPWLMCTAYIILLGLLVRWRWQSGHWRTIRLFGTPEEAAIEAVAQSESAFAPASAP